MVTKLSVEIVSLTTGDGVLENNVLVAIGNEKTSTELPMEIVSLIIADGEMGGEVTTTEPAVALVVVISKVLMIVVGDGVLTIVVVGTAVVVGVTITQSTK